MKNRISICMLLLLICSCSSMQSLRTHGDQTAKDKVIKISMRDGMLIPAHDIYKLEIEALQGSVKAADRLSKHYEYAMSDHKKALYWAQIQAENGDAYNFGFFLKENSDYKSHVRARYWLKLAQKKGDTLATMLLDEMDNEAKSGEKGTR